MSTPEFSLEFSPVADMDADMHEKLTQVLLYLKNAMNKPHDDLTDHEFQSLDFIAGIWESDHEQNDQEGFTLSLELIEKLYNEIELSLYNEIQEGFSLSFELFEKLYNEIELSLYNEIESMSL